MNCPRARPDGHDAFVVRDLPWTIDKLKQLPPFESENWAVIALGGIPNKAQVGDIRGGWASTAASSPSMA